LIFLRLELVDTRSEVGWVTTECNIHHFQELVHSRDQTLWRCARRLFGWDTLETDNFIGEVSGHNEIMLYDESALFAAQNPSLDNFSSNNSLLRIQVSRWLINKENVARLSETKHDSDSLKLSS